MQLLMYTVEAILLDLRILNAVIAVIIALYYMKFFDNIFKLILEDTLSYELSLPVKMSSLRLILYFPDDNEGEVRNGSDFFLQNAQEKENEKKMIDLEDTDKTGTREIKDPGSFISKKITIDSRSSISGSFDKFVGLFSPTNIRNSKSFLVAEKYKSESVTKRIESKTKHNEAHQQRKFNLRNFLGYSQLLLKPFSTFSLLWNIIISIFLRLYSVRGFVIITNLLVLSPVKEIDPRWTTECIVVAEKIKITFNFFRALYYFFFSFTKFIVFDNVFVDGLTINVEGYEERNGIQSHNSKDSQTVGTTENNHSNITENNIETLSASDKINNDIKCIYNNFIASINVRSETIYNVSLFGKTLPNSSTSSSLPSTSASTSKSTSPSNSTSSSVLHSNPSNFPFDMTGSKTKEKITSVTGKYGNNPKSDRNSVTVKGKIVSNHGNDIISSAGVCSATEIECSNFAENKTKYVEIFNDNNGKKNLNENSKNEKDITIKNKNEIQNEKLNDKEKENKISQYLIDGKKAESKEELKSFDLFNSIPDQMKEQFNSNVRTLHVHT